MNDRLTMQSSTSVEVLHKFSMQNVNPVTVRKTTQSTHFPNTFTCMFLKACVYIWPEGWNERVMFARGGWKVEVWILRDAPTAMLWSQHTRSHSNSRGNRYKWSSFKHHTNISKPTTSIRRESQDFKDKRSRLSEHQGWRSGWTSNKDATFIHSVFFITLAPKTLMKHF